MVGQKSENAKDATAFKTAAELKSDAMLTTLGEAFAADTTGINSGYPVLAWQNPAEPTVMGDVNGDGVVLANDAALVYAFVNGETELTAEQLALADLTGDGKIMSDDAALIYAIANGKN